MSDSMNDDDSKSARLRAKEIAETLFREEGVIARLEQIKKMLGRGSNTSIAQGIQEWITELHTQFMRLTSRPDIPDSLMKVFNEFFGEAIKVSDQKFNAERKQIANELKDSQNLLQLRDTENDNITQKVERLIAETDQLTLQMQSQKRDHANELAEVKKSATSLQGELDKEKQEKEKLEKEISKQKELNSNKDLERMQLQAEKDKLRDFERARYDAMERRLIDKMTKDESEKNRAVQRADKLHETMKSQAEGYAQQIASLHEKHQAALFASTERNEIRLSACRDEIKSYQDSYALLQNKYRETKSATSTIHKLLSDLLGRVSHPEKPMMEKDFSDVIKTILTLSKTQLT